MVLVFIIFFPFILLYFLCRLVVEVVIDFYRYIQRPTMEREERTF